jgi:hypothetical protein
MPRSKHRRKPGGKAVPHPGRGKQPRTYPDPEIVLWRQFRDAYSQPFQDDSAPPGAGFLLDLIADAAFNMTGTGSLRPVSKADVFGEFMLPLHLDPVEDWEGAVLPPKHETPESAEAALAFLVEQEMVEVTGDTITVPARFWSGAPAGAT